MNADRRAYLGAVAGVAATAVGGCLGLGGSTGDDGESALGDGSTRGGGESSPGGDGSGGTDSPVESTGAARSASPNGSPSGGGESTDAGPLRAGSTVSGDPELVLESVGLGRPDSLTVYPPPLAETLRTAAETGETVRTHADTHVYVPEPVLPAVDRLELVDPGTDVDGVYDVAADGGTYYDLLVGAEEASPPYGEPVTPVSELPADRRELVRAAVGPERLTVTPETERGEWVRESFFREYVEYEGTVYRGKEVQQTDAAFFSTEVWYVCSLDPADGSAKPSLRLADVPDEVREVVDPLLAERSRRQGVVRQSLDEVPDAVAAFVDETDAILTHVGAFSLAIDGER